MSSPLDILAEMAVKVSQQEDLDRRGITTAHRSNPQIVMAKVVKPARAIPIAPSHTISTRRKPVMFGAECGAVLKRSYSNPPLRIQLIDTQTTFLNGGVDETRSTYTVK